jgi:hypothetical protein
MIRRAKHRHLSLPNPELLASAIDRSCAMRNEPTRRRKPWQPTSTPVHPVQPRCDMGRYFAATFTITGPLS